MTRKKLYEEIRSLKLQGEIKAKFGCNYTNVSNEYLEKVVNQAKAALNPVKEVIPKTVASSKVLNKLIEVLSKKNILLKSEVYYILH